ncbi:phosphotransferase enzyme family protein [Micromonospora aurantiaca]|nr:phosphotransferase [Micromonospora aurantiaca]ADL45393.1 aminoglycoside phosphotransferase [Micromonospora aurantiaca ATCC 27029]
MRSTAASPDNLRSQEAERIAAALDARVLPAFGMYDGTLSLLKNSENLTFRWVGRVAGRGTLNRVVRVGRPDYHDLDSVRSELALLDVLASRLPAATPVPVPRLDGDPLAALPPSDGADVRPIAVFEWVDGHPGSTGARQSWTSLHQLGVVVAALHNLGPEAAGLGLSRPKWDWEALVGTGMWRTGDRTWSKWGASAGAGWIAALENVAPVDRRCLDEMAARTRDAMAQLNSEDGNWGLIHGDLNPSNVLTTDDGVGLIDFDDCGWGLHVYDLAVALLWPYLNGSGKAARDALLAGYRTVRPLPASAEASLELMVAARSLALVRYFSGRTDSPRLRAWAPTFLPRAYELLHTIERHTR